MITTAANPLLHKPNASKSKKSAPGVSKSQSAPQGELFTLFLSSLCYRKRI